MRSDSQVSKEGLSQSTFTAHGLVRDPHHLPKGTARGSAFPPGQHRGHRVPRSRRQTAGKGSVPLLPVAFVTETFRV